VYFDILYSFLYETSLILRRIQWDVMHARVSSCEVPVILSRINGSRISSTNFWKNSRIKFQGNPSSGSSIVPIRSHRRADTWQS